MKRTPSSNIERLLNRDVSDGQIVKEIIAEAKIPWATKIEKVRVNRNV